jgi:hypothetical protein
MGLNLNYLASGALQAIYDKVSIDLKLFSEQSNSFGTITNTYTTIENIYANMQLANKQTLQQIDGYNQTKIYKSFWINSDQLTGLNRNISTGGDFIIWNNLYYKIIEVQDNFLTGWVLVHAVESCEI